MAKQFKKTKLAAAVCAAAGLGLASSANAVVVVGGDNGWEVSFDGNINAFYTTGDYDAGYSTLGFAGTSNARDVSRVASGFLPAFFSFNVKSPTVNGMTATGRFSFAPAIQNGNAKNQTYATGLTGNGATNGIQGSSIDMREVVVNLDGNFGTVSFGRTLSIFGRQAILKDMTLFGVGASQVQNGSVAAGRIGRGYTYPNFNARFSYKTPNMNGFQAEIGLYDPSTEQAVIGAGILDETDTPRFEGEVSYTTAFSGGSFQVWVDGLWQNIESSRAGATGDVQVSGFGVGANVKMAGFDVVGYYYGGDGLGRSLQFLGGTRCNNGGSVGTVCQENEADGYYVQGSYTFNGKTRLGVSYGESTEDGFSAMNGTVGGTNTGATTGVDLSMLTVGVYHDINSWLKVIAEYSHLENDFGGTSNDPEADTFSVGSFLFW